MNLAITGPWHSVDLLLKVLNLARNRYTPPTDYRRELEAFPVDADGLRCPAEEAAGVRLCGRRGTVILRAGDSPESVIEAVRAVIPADAPVAPGERRSWAMDVLEYVQTVSAATLPPDRPASA